MTAPRLAVLPDFPEERWPSMDLCAEMLLREMQPLAHRVNAVRICPTFKRHFRFIPYHSRSGLLVNFDRLLNRMRRYPRFARSLSHEFDWFHLCDHSYSQILHELPVGRAGVLCHDLDTFRCLLDPAAEPRPKWFRRMMRTILTGFQKAAVVFYTTTAVREQIERYGLIDPAKLVQVPLGSADEFTHIGPVHESESPYLLHVGSTIPRKRIDVLLDVFAGALRHFPSLSMEQIGGEWTTAQRQQIERLNIGAALRQQRGLSRNEIATLYRGAGAVLVTSEAEGFGLPLIEALACGAAVIASDLPVLREVGGDAAQYCPVGEVPIWIERISQTIGQGTQPSSVNRRLAQAAKFSWRRHAEVIAETYETLARGIKLGSDASSPLLAAGPKARV